MKTVLSPNSQCKLDPPAPCHEAICMPGYRGNGWECSDIDECIDPLLQHNCHPDALCFNTDGSFDCVCRAGTFGDGTETCITEYCPDGWYGPNSTYCFKIPENAQCTKIPDEAHLNTGEYHSGEGEVNACINIECKYGYEIKCGVNEDCFEMGKKADLGWVNSMPGATYLQGSNANCEGQCANKVVLYRGNRLHCIT